MVATPQEGIVVRLLEPSDSPADLATDLIASYGKRGYRFVDNADFRPVVNYLSVVLSKKVYRVER